MLFGWNSPSGKSDLDLAATGAVVDVVWATAGKAAAAEVNNICLRVCFLGVIFLRRSENPGAARPAR